MLTGFNTDIKHDERVYHVQTEDRGLSNPVVESLVYVGGEILLSKKSPYDKHVHGDKIDEKAVREMMDFQHRRIIEAIRRGRFDAKKPGEAILDLGEETFPTPPGVSPAAVAAVAAILSAPVEPLPGDVQAAPARRKPSEKSGVRPAVRPAAAPAPVPTPSAEPPLSKPGPSLAKAPAAPSGPPPEQRIPLSKAATSDFVVETVISPHPGTGAAPPPQPTAPFPSAISPAVKPPATAAGEGGEAAPRKTPASTSGARTLDQVIVEYLASEAASERLEVSVMAGGEFVSGTTVPLTVIASTSLSRKPVAGAQVTVRVVSTGGPPQILFRGTTGNDGLVKTSCALPEIGSGNAALIVVAFSPIGSGETKYLIRKKGT